MKKTVLTVVALVCALCCVFALAACNDKTDKVAVTSVTLDKTELSLTVGDSETLTATVAPDDATDSSVTWTSDNAEVANVENGVVTALKAGTATITAKAGDKSADCVVTVSAPNTKMSADEWTACVNAFAKSTNYTEKWSSVKTGYVTTAYTVTGATCRADHFASADGEWWTSDIYQKVGDDFYHFTKDDDDYIWYRQPIGEEEYTEGYTSISYLTDAANILIEKYADLSFADGKYSLATYDFDGIDVTNIEATVSGGAIVKLTFTAEYVGNVVIDSFGATQVEVPAEYTELDVVAGKSFHFDRLTWEGDVEVTDEDLEEYGQLYGEMHIFFGKDKTVSITIKEQTMSGTYTISGNTITITLSPAEASPDPITIVGNELKMPVAGRTGGTGGEGHSSTIYVILRDTTV